MHFSQSFYYVICGRGPFFSVKDSAIPALVDLISHHFLTLLVNVVLKSRWPVPHFFVYKFNYYPFPVILNRYK